MNKDKPDEDKLDIRDVRIPYCARWMKISFKPNDIPFEDLPTPEEVLEMVKKLTSERDRALLLTLYETACSPKELLNLRLKDIAFNQHGAKVTFPRYTDAKTNETNELKTAFRYRTVPIATAVPDLHRWYEKHPEKNDLDAPLWLSLRGGAIGYNRLYEIFNEAKRKAGITKRFTLYSFRHRRLTEMADVLSPHELKRIAGHSKYSQVTPRYLHADDKAIEKKIYKERGLEIEEEEPLETQLSVRVCPRCKHKNSPTYRFCAMCSMPLDTKTMFEAQRQGEKLMDFVNRLGVAIGVDNETKALVLQQIGTDREHEKCKRINPNEDIEAFLALMQLSPKIKQLYTRLWENVATEEMKLQTQTPTAKTT